MAANPLIPPKFRALDSNADPLSGGLLYSYAAGTTTPLATYTTRAGTVANANPVVMDANGEANVWMAPGVDYKFELRSSAGVVQWTIDNVPSAAESNTSTDAIPDPGGRLTLVTGTPVYTFDVDASTVYYVPYKNNRVPLYDGEAWSLHAIATELSQTLADNTKSPSAAGANFNYDLFIWEDSGVLRLSRGPAWTTSSARGTGAATTELERVDGRLVNKVSISNGPAAQRGLYVGTIRTRSDGATIVSDRLTHRHVWNAYNWVERPMAAPNFGAAWAYTTATFRQAEANATMQLDFVLGLNEAPVKASVSAVHSNNTGAIGVVSIGLDGTTAIADIVTAASHSASSQERISTAHFNGFVGLGRHTLVWLEKVAVAAGTTTWYGLSLGTQSGIYGSLLG